MITTQSNYPRLIKRTVEETVDSYGHVTKRVTVEEFEEVRAPVYEWSNENPIVIN